MTGRKVIHGTGISFSAGLNMRRTKANRGARNDPDGSMGAGLDKRLDTVGAHPFSYMILNISQ